MSGFAKLPITLRRKLKIIPGLLIVLCCMEISYLWTPRVRVFVNQALWELFGPSHYYAEIVEARPEAGLWRWAVYVQDDEVDSVELLDSRNTHGHQPKLDQETLTIKQIFSAADLFCARWGWAECSLHFESRFHYPQRIVSDEIITIRVERLIPCETNFKDCLIDNDP